MGSSPDSRIRRFISDTVSGVVAASDPVVAAVLGIVLDDDDVLLLLLPLLFFGMDVMDVVVVL